MGNTFGTLFRVTTFGESHGGGVGAVIDGCPPGVELDLGFIQSELDRRRPGQSNIVSQRSESDQFEIVSGLNEAGLTLGTPIAVLVRNTDARSDDYDEMKQKFRPSHADFTYDEKYGLRAWQGGGRSSARETVGRVIGGAIAKQVLAKFWSVEILAWVESVQEIVGEIDENSVTTAEIEANVVRCPDPDAAARMIDRIQAVRKEGNSVGGTIRAIAKNVPTGWGEPVFDRLEADLAKALLSLPACKGFEVGSGFAGTLETGLTHNDLFRNAGGKKVETTTNHSGGIQGGISNGMPIRLRAAFKPTATVMRDQPTVDIERQNTTLQGRGRHDPCVLPRAVVMVESMVALVLVDHALRQQPNLLGR